MRLVTLFLFAALATTSVDAAWCQQIDGTIINPIQRMSLGGGGNHPYSGVNLEPGADLNHASLSFAILDDADLTDANLSNADLTGANLEHAGLKGAGLAGADLTDADLTDADLAWASLTYANLSNADLAWASLTYANLTDVNLSNADLTGADLLGTNISNSQLRSASNLTRVHLGTICTPPPGECTQSPDLTGWDLSGLDLTDATLYDLDLSNADFTGTDLTGARLQSVNLTNANLTGTNLTDADLRRSHFSLDTVLPDGQTVGEHGFDEAGLESYWTTEVGVQIASRITITTGLAGDYNDNSVIDAADYTIWQDNLGLDSSVLSGNGSGGATVRRMDYSRWKLNFGRSGAGVGDFNNDGVINAADFTVWQDNLGLSSSALNGNGSGAATVVQADYLLWKTNFEALATGPEGTTAVPEPTTLLLALLALVAAPLRVRCG